MLVEIHHLEAIELLGDFLDLLFLARLDDLYTRRIPSQISKHITIAIVHSTHHLI